MMTGRRTPCFDSACSTNRFAVRSLGLQTKKEHVIPEDLQAEEELPQRRQEIAMRRHLLGGIYSVGLMGLLAGRAPRCD